MVGRPWPPCLADFRRINLHWHDLRHEYASRLVERGAPLSQVRDLLGHALIVTTERYDNQQLERLQVAAGNLEAGKSFEPRVAAWVETGRTATRERSDRSGRRWGFVPIRNEPKASCDVPEDLPSSQIPRASRDVAGCQGRFPQLDGGKRRLTSAAAARAPGSP